MADVPLLKNPAESSVILTDKISKLAEALFERLQSQPALKRQLLFVSDSVDLESFRKTSLAQNLWADPRFCVQALGSELLNYGDYEKMYKPTDKDLTAPVEFLVFMDSTPALNQWIAQIQAHHGQMLQSLDLQSEFNFSTDPKDRLIGFENTLKNLERTLLYPDCRNWNGLMKKVPAFVIGAGPSIDEFLPLLKKWEGRAVFIAADTMLKPLQRVGIEAHILASIERDHEIVNLLDDPHDHSNSVLCASTVLQPKSFEVYRGPFTTVLGQYRFNEWLPFRRMMLSYGYSCLGLAVPLALYLQCDPIYLVGMDLSWADSGMSHAQNVPYLQDEKYKSQYGMLREHSFIKLNNAGERVRTHMFWNMFQQETEKWIRQGSSRFFNLSRQGVKIEGAPYIEPANIQVLGERRNISAEILKSMPYDRTAEVKDEIRELSSRADAVLSSLPGLIKNVEAASPAEIVNYLKAQPYFETLLFSIFKGDIRRMLSEEAGAKEHGRSNVRKYLPELGPIVENGVKIASQLAKSGRDLF